MSPGGEGRATRILLVDDSPEDAEMAVRELRRAGVELEPRHVATRPDYERALREFGPDLILSDYAMPHMDGPAAVALARSACPDVPVIVVSGTIGEELAIETMKAGATDYVMKDRLARLAPAVRRALEEARERAERRRTEQALRESEGLYRTLVAALGEGVVLVQADGRITTCNEAAARITGLRSHDVMARTVTDPRWRVVREDATPLPPDELPVALCLATGEPQVNRVVGLERADGSLAWLSVTCQPVFAVAGGRPTAAVVSFADITEQRTLEEQLRQSQRLESIGQLAGGVAHDFNNLMTVVRGYSEMALAQLRRDDPLRRDLEEIRRAGERAAALTRQLLAFSRKQVLLPKALDLNEVLEDLVPMLRRLIREDIRLTVAAGPGLGTVVADPGQVEQVIVNLAVNARDAMPGGGELRFETRNARLDEEYARRHLGVVPGDYVELVVRDSGEGMEPRVLARIFEPFFTTKEKGKGTGLGLSTVYGIVRQSGGHIWVESEPGKGTAFRIALPRVRPGALAGAGAPGASGTGAPEAGAAARGTGPSAEEGALPRGRETVLVVEDEDQVRPLIREVLERHGYRVLEAARGESAIAACRDEPGEIRLLITDMVMPGMSGAELAERAVALRPGLRVLFLSGYSEESVSGLALLGPGRSFLQKPFSMEALASRVREVLDGPGER